MPRLFLILALFTLFSCTSQSNEKAEADVRQRSESYILALNKKEVAPLLSFWAEEGIFRNPLTGKLIRGKHNIKNEYLALFNEIKEAKMALKIHSISFPFRDKALVEGAIILEGAERIERDLSILLVKKGKTWKILNISEINILH